LTIQTYEKFGQVVWGIRENKFEWFVVCGFYLYNLYFSENQILISDVTVNL
jgi:hypothetical protein